MSWFCSSIKIAASGFALDSDFVIVFFFLNAIEFVSMFALMVWLLQFYTYFP